GAWGSAFLPAGTGYDGAQFGRSDGGRRCVGEWRRLPAAIAGRSSACRLLRLFFTQRAGVQDIVATVNWMGTVGRRGGPEGSHFHRPLRLLGLLQGQVVVQAALLIDV